MVGTLELFHISHHPVHSTRNYPSLQESRRESFGSSSRRKDDCKIQKKKAMCSYEREFRPSKTNCHAEEDINRDESALSRRDQIANLPHRCMRKQPLQIFAFVRKSDKEVKSNINFHGKPLITLKWFSYTYFKLSDQS